MSSVKVENIIIENDQISTCLVILDNKQKYEVEYKANEYFVTQLTSSSPSPSPQLTLETAAPSHNQEKLEKTIETIVKQLKDSKSK